MIIEEKAKAYEVAKLIKEKGFNELNEVERRIENIKEHIQDLNNCLQSELNSLNKIIE